MNTPANYPMPDDQSINQRAATAVRSHRLKLRVLTATTFGFGFLAVAISIFVVWAYLILFLPKQREMLQRTEEVVAQKNSSSDVGLSVRQLNEFMQTEVVITHVISMAVTILALSVGLLGLGMLILMTVVILNRRVTLNQISLNLAQISSQLRELQKPTDCTG